MQTKHASITKMSRCWEKKKKLQDLPKQEDTSTDPEPKHTLQYMIKVEVDALKSRFQQEEITGLKQHIFQERRRKAVQLKWCSNKEAKLQYNTIQKLIVQFAEKSQLKHAIRKSIRN